MTTWKTDRAAFSATLITRFVAVLCVALLAHAPGCGGAKHDYTTIVDCDGQPALKISCQYTGKSPGDPATYQSDHDYRRINTDFYRITMENLTDADIVIERVTYRMQNGPTRGPQSAPSESIQRTWGTNRIPAGSKISRANNFVWSKSRRNTLLKTYWFRRRPPMAASSPFPRRCHLPTAAELRIDQHAALRVVPSDPQLSFLCDLAQAGFQVGRFRAPRGAVNNWLLDCRRR